MAILTFDQLLDAPEALTQLNIANEPDNTLTKFGITTASLQGNYLAELKLSQYPLLNWVEKYSLLTSSEIMGIGVKHFPQIGSIGYYKLKHENKSVVIAPIFTKNKKYVSPVLTVAQVGSNLHFTIAQPEDVTYECFRIIMRNGYDATEIITYDLTCDAPLPYPDGNYIIQCVGYIEEQLASQPSPELPFVVTGSINPFQPSPVPTNIQAQIDALALLVAAKFDAVELDSGAKLMRFLSEATVKQSVDITKLVNIIDEDAPADTKQYGRQQIAGGMAWTEVGSTVVRPYQRSAKAMETNGTTLTITGEAQAGDVAIVACVTRSSFTPPTGWTLIHSSAGLPGSTYTQYMSVYAIRSEEAATIAFTVTYAASARMYLNMHIVKGSGELPAYVEGSELTVTSPAKAVATAIGDSWPVLHCVHSVNWDTSGEPYVPWATSVDTLPVVSVAPSQGRLGTIFDQITSTPLEISLPFSATYEFQYFQILLH